MRRLLRYLVAAYFIGSKVTTWIGYGGLPDDLAAWGRLVGAVMPAVASFVNECVGDHKQ